MNDDYSEAFEEMFHHLGEVPHLPKREEEPERNSYLDNSRALMAYDAALKVNHVRAISRAVMANIFLMSLVATAYAGVLKLLGAF